MIGKKVQDGCSSTFCTGGVASVAQNYDLKGVWHNAAGKVVSAKDSVCESELKKRFPTVWRCFVDLPVHIGNSRT
jgi:hypothetical protein